MPIIGMVASKVPQNPKCNGCHHYATQKSLCEIGLAPSSCGDGSMPDIGYAPVSGPFVDGVTAESPDHVAPARGGGEVPDSNPRIPIITSHLGDDSELLAMAKSMLPDMVKACQWGCAMHQYGAVSGQHNLHTGGSSICKCLKLDTTELVGALHKSLSNTVRPKVTREDMIAWLDVKLPSLVPYQSIL